MNQLKIATFVTLIILVAFMGYENDIRAASLYRLEGVVVTKVENDDFGPISRDTLDSVFTLPSNVPESLFAEVLRLPSDTSVLFKPYPRCLWAIIDETTGLTCDF